MSQQKQRKNWRQNKEEKPVNTSRLLVWGLINKQANKKKQQPKNPQNKTNTKKKTKKKQKKKEKKMIKKEKERP